MARPPLPVGVHGNFRSYRTAKGWRSRTTVGEEDGVTREIQRTGRTKAESERNLSLALRDRDPRAQTNDQLKKSSTVKSVAEAWFASLHEISPSTAQIYRDRLDKQVLPKLGNRAISDLTVGVVDQHIGDIQDKHGKSIAKLTKSVLSGVCGYAARRDLLPNNPVRDVRRVSTRPKKSPMSLSVDEARKVRVELAKDAEAARRGVVDLVSFMLASGCRIGEALAIRWADVDLDAATVAIHGTVLRIKGQGLIIKPAPKTKASERTLEIPSWCVEMLRARAGAPGTLVFPSELGHLRDPSNTRRDLRVIFKRLGFEGLTSHVFRKTTASLMDDAGLPARAASDQLGHSRVSQTQDTYYGRKVRKTGAAEVLEALRD